MPVLEVGSPRWWLNRLWPELLNRQAGMKEMDAFYVGDHPLPFLTKAHQDKIRSEFRRLLDESRSNFMRLVVDVVEERLVVEGFRLSAASDAAADEQTWAIWQANQLDSESSLAFVDALVKGRSYLSVWAADEPDGYPRVAVEDPLETIVAYVGGSGYRRRAAALKTWRDEWTGARRANVYLPNGIFKFEADTKAAEPGSLSTDASRRLVEPQTAWKELEDGFVANPVGVVPIVPLRNRPRVLCEGESELSDIFRVQNQINSLLFMLALAGYFGAHRQRWVAGIEIVDDENGNPVEPYDAAIDKLWTAENADVKFGEFSQTDLGPYINAIEQKVLHIAVTTRTPRHYLIEQGQSPSGDAIKSAESGLVKKVERKQANFGEGLEEALRLARRFAGAQDSPVDSEIVWADAQVRTEAETTDAAIKRFQAGLTTWEQTLEDLGYSPQQIARMSVARQEDALLAALREPVAVPVAEPETEAVA